MELYFNAMDIGIPLHVGPCLLAQGKSAGESGPVHDAICRYRLLVIHTIFGRASAINSAAENDKKITNVSVLVARFELAVSEKVRDSNAPKFCWGSRMPRTANASSVISADPKVQLLIQLLKVASLIGRPVQDGAAGPSDIGLNELKIVMCFGGKGALAARDIIEMVAMPQMNVSRAFAGLVARGWIEPAADYLSRRRKVFCLTADGWTAYRFIKPAVGSVADYLLGGLSESERKSFARTTDKVVARMESWARDCRAD
jgi:DNA-binding MarR family transcriptional regulator